MHAPQVRRFSTAGDDGRTAFDRWIALGSQITPTFEVTGDRAPFRVEAELIVLPGVSVGRFDFAGMTYERTTERIRRVHDGDVVLQLTHAGLLSGELGDVTTTSGVRVATAFDLGRPSRHISSDARGRTLSFSRDLIPTAARDRLHGATATGAGFRLLDDYLRWIAARAPQARLSDAWRGGEAVAAVVLACLGLGRWSEPAPQILGVLAVERARRFIDADPARPILIAEVAHAAGVSRSTLFRLFQPFGGVAEYAWRARLECARRRLSDPEEQGSIAHAALACGFGEAKHFSSRFREHYGFSPRNLRPF